ALAATKMALDDAGASIPLEGDDGLGVVLGTWSAGGGSTQHFLDALFRKGPLGAPALLFDSTVANAAASLAGLEQRFRGPNLTVSHKEASGGADAIFEMFYKAHDRFAVMSPDAVFSRRLAPFDAARDGFVLGEGAFCLW